MALATNLIPHAIETLTAGSAAQDRRALGQDDTARAQAFGTRLHIAGAGEPFPIGTIWRAQDDALNPSAS